MAPEYDFPSIIEDSFDAAFYTDTIDLAEVYLAILSANHQDLIDNEKDSKVLFYLASSYHMTGCTEHAIYLLEHEKSLSPINAYLLARYYFTLKRYDKFIHCCMAKASYRPESDHGHTIIKKFGKYSGYVMKMLSQHLYSINKVSQAESMLNFSLKINPFMISALHRSIQQDGNRNPYDHFKSFIKATRKRSSNDIDTKLATLDSAQATNEMTKFVPQESELTDQFNYNENDISVSRRIQTKIETEQNIHSPKKITGTLAASTPMNLPNNSILLQPSKNYDSNSISASANNVIISTPFGSNVRTFDQTTLTENSNHSSTTHYKTPQPRFNPVQVYDHSGVGGGHRESVAAPSRARHTQLHKTNDVKTPKNIRFDSTTYLSETNSYTSDSLSLPIPDIITLDENTNDANQQYSSENSASNPRQSALDTNSNPSESSDSNDTLIDDIAVASDNCTEIQPRHHIVLPDSLLNGRTTTSFGFIIVDALYKVARVQYYLVRYDCDQVIKLYDLLPAPLRALPNSMSALAVALFHKHNYKACINVFKHLSHDYPYYCKGFEYYSTALWHTKNFTQLEYVSSFLKHHMPLCAQTWITVGNFHSLSKQPDVAIQCFRRSIQLESKNAYACALLGKEYWDMDREKEAMTFYRRGLLADRYFYQLWYLISEAHMHKQQFSLAEQCINTAIRINSRDPVVWAMAAAVDFANNRCLAATNKIDRSIMLDESNESFLIFKVEILMRVKKLAEAKDILLSIIARNKFTENAVQIYMLLGKIFLSMDDFQTAEIYLTKCIDLDLGGASCAEARKIMGKIGLLHGGSSSKKNLLLDVNSEKYLCAEYDTARGMLDFIRKNQS